MRSKSRFTTLVLFETRESYLQVRVQSQDTRTISTSSKCHLRVHRFIEPIAFDGGYHSSCLGARNVRLGSFATSHSRPVIRDQSFATSRSRPIRVPSLHSLESRPDFNAVTSRM